MLANQKALQLHVGIVEIFITKKNIITNIIVGG